MKTIFIIGGMGAGKTTVANALAEEGLGAFIDLDEIGHEVLMWDIVKDELIDAFGGDILDETGQIDRSALAAKAFDTSAHTRKLNHITMPRIEEAFTERLDELEASGVDAVVVEYSVFKDRMSSLAHSADVIIAVLAPTDMRIERAVAAGFDEDDVRRRIAQQITDTERLEAADVAFNNDGTPEELHDQVIAWWENASGRSDR